MEKSPWTLFVHISYDYYDYTILNAYNLVCPNHE